MKLKLLSSLLVLSSVCEVQTVYCMPPSYGACLERTHAAGNYEVDNDCCAGCGHGSCAPGYTLSTQTAIAEGGSWDRPADAGFNPQCENLYSACNTCCTPTGSVNTGISNTCEVGEPITVEDECRAATLVLSATSQFSGFGYKETVSLDYAPNGCFVYDGDPEYHGFYLNTHAGSATGTSATGVYHGSDHHKVRRPRAPCDPAHAQPPENLCVAPLALHTPAPGVQGGGRVETCLQHQNGLHHAPGHGRAGRSNHLPGTDVPRRPSHRHLQLRPPHGG